jgi:hypothetical protein
VNKKGKLGVHLTATNIAEMFEEEKVIARGGKSEDDSRDIGRRIGIYLKPVFEFDERRTVPAVDRSQPTVN